MRDVTIRDYIGSAKEIAAAELRKMPEGTKVIVHRFDRSGNHTTLLAWVWIGTGKFLRYEDIDGTTSTMKIKKETDRMCYTEVK